VSIFNPSDEYVTVQEAAEALAVSEKSVRRWIDDGKLLAYYAGPRNVRIKRGDLNKIINPTNA
jgi:excisionase family DNA binding protein